MSNKPDEKPNVERLDDNTLIWTVGCNPEPQPTGGVGTVLDEWQAKIWDMPGGCEPAIMQELIDDIRKATQPTLLYGVMVAEDEHGLMWFSKPDRDGEVKLHRSLEGAMKRVPEPSKPTGDVGELLDALEKWSEDISYEPPKDGTEILGRFDGEWHVVRFHSWPVGGESDDYGCGSPPDGYQDGWVLTGDGLIWFESDPEMWLTITAIAELQEELKRTHMERTLFLRHVLEIAKANGYETPCEVHAHDWLTKTLPETLDRRTELLRKLSKLPTVNRHCLFCKREIPIHLMLCDNPECLIVKAREHLEGKS